MVSRSWQTEQGSKPVPWPDLRDELRLHHGPSLADGQPSWTIHDPVRHRFVRIDWTTYEVIRRWWLGAPQLIAEQVNAQTTLSIDETHVQLVMDFARDHALLDIRTEPKPTEPPKGWRAFGQWLLHHYLFFRVPLFNPDRFLLKTMPLVSRFSTASFRRATVAALICAVVFVLRDWETFSRQAVDMLSWRGLLLYVITLTLVKIAHEFGHAFAAKRHGCRVPTMGVAFMVLWPVAYTDTTDVWRLADHRSRLQVALAGVKTELTIAAWALLSWTWLPDGPVRTAMFLLGTFTWISTVVVNLSPFMRFDGYFALCDVLDQPNLHERSFSMARWWVRRVLLGWDRPPPESQSRTVRRAMIMFAFTTWAYRLVLYLGIAWLVYHFAFKALGILLFTVEIAWFIILPVYKEMNAWWMGRLEWLGSQRSRRWRYLAPLLVAAGFVPLPSFEGAGAVLQPTHHLAVRVPAVAVIDQVLVKGGDVVVAGAPLFTATSQQLIQRREAAKARIRQLEQQVSGASLDPSLQYQWSGLQEQLATSRDEEIAIVKELVRYSPRAPFKGTVIEIDPSIHVGAVINSQQVLLQIADGGEWRVVAYASESAARSLESGDNVRFVADAHPWRSISATVASVSPHPALMLAEPMLAQLNGGAIDAVLQGSQWLPKEAYYRVEMSVTTPLDISPRQWRGHVRLSRDWRSLWSRVWTSTAAVLSRELGF